MFSASSQRYSLLPPRCFAYALRFLVCLLTVNLSCSFSLKAQTLDEQLQQESPKSLAAVARTEGDAGRGAIVFFQPQTGCSKCHSVGGNLLSALGPDLATQTQQSSDESLVESVLMPSKVIRKGFESVTLVTSSGLTAVGVLVSRNSDAVIIRDATRNGEEASFAVKDLDDIVGNTVSLMPAGQMNQLSSRQQFLDLVRYLMEIRDGGALRAAQLQPAAALLTLKVPEYEQHINHAGFIREWNDESFSRGEAIYRRVCMNCHGTKEQIGSLPTSLRFASGRFRNGHDPFTMYQTLTRGFGLMAAQTWMVPSQKYDVIHYIRETYLKNDNPSQFSEVDDSYLSKLPSGETRGPEPSLIQPWNAMDYGSALTHTYEIPGADHNLAYKGIAVRLDPGAGGVSRGHHWMIFETDTLRMAAAWSAPDQPDAEHNFIDWRGIQFNGEHQIHPHVTGRVIASNSTGPGWADPATGAIEDDRRVQGRDGRKYGPLPRNWGKFHGTYYHGQNVILSYSVGSTDVLEMPAVQIGDDSQTPPAFLRTINVGPRSRPITLQIAQQPSAVLTNSGTVSAADSRQFSGSAASSQSLPATLSSAEVIRFGSPLSDSSESQIARPVLFNGQTFLQVEDAAAFDMTSHDFTITARVKTSENGTLFAMAKPESQWTPDGQAFFIRDGHLAFDIGWVGAVTARSTINDNQWHDVAAVWSPETQKLQLFVDGKVDGQGTLAAKSKLNGGVVRVGFTAPNFPAPSTFLTGQLADIRFYQRCLSSELKSPGLLAEATDGLVAHWDLQDAAGPVIIDQSGNKHHATVHQGEAPTPAGNALLAGVSSPQIPQIPLTWSTQDDRLLLTIPAGDESLRFTVWMAAEPQSQTPQSDTAAAAASPVQWKRPHIPVPDQDLKLLTQGGPARWNQLIRTPTSFGTETGPFATDVLTAPDANPWLALTRFTGLDFFADGRMAVCSWDGDVWIVDGFLQDSEPALSTGPASKLTATEDVAPGTLTWQRIASGLFQPLGLKIVNEQIHVTCRDQLAVLHDLNGDEEIDFYECLNNDHQVTEHFHEFAMGLQTDSEGNFYYAKSGRHALEAVVPHHGTLLKVSKDGSRTEILATGFRAANGVCLNPNGSFVVTDQEGFWNPKNRINWVTLDPGGHPKFYGNMFGYHDVTDSSDDAMEPPLCWITNAFDRSPGELLWVNSEKWGPLKGSLLNLSYGYGKVFLVPHESVTIAGKGVQMQGGMIELPISAFPTGVMRGRFHPRDGQLYLCGMFAWAGSATQPGGLYRLRATGKPVHLPVELHARRNGMELIFPNSLQASSIIPDNVQVRTWSLKRSANYGSEHYDERQLPVEATTLSGDGRTLTIKVKDLRPTWCMEIRFSLKAADGNPVTGVIHNTIHQLTE